jgi:CheY-like chemotaxis protein
MTNSSIFHEEVRALLLVCVDDNSRFLAVLMRLLRALGYDVTATNDPKDVLPLVAVTLPDAVILVPEMPHADGTELAQRINRLCPQLPIVLLPRGSSQPERTPFSPTQYPLREQADEDVA